MPQVYQDIQSAIENYMIDTFGEALIVFENTSVPNKEVDEHLRVKIDFVSRIRETITGDPVTGQKITGLLTVQVLNPANTKTVAAFRKVDDVVNAFNELRLPAGTDYDDICFLVPQVDNVGNARPQWHQINVTCPFSQLLIKKP